MTWHTCRISQHLTGLDPPFYALIMAAMRKADNINRAKLRKEWPDVWNELDNRFNAPGGLLPGERWSNNDL